MFTTNFYETDVMFQKIQFFMVCITHAYICTVVKWRGGGVSTNLVGIICPLVRIGLTDFIIEIILINQVKNFYEVLLTYPM